MGMGAPASKSEPWLMLATVMTVPLAVMRMVGRRMSMKMRVMTRMLLGTQLLGGDQFSYRSGRVIGGDGCYGENDDGDRFQGVPDIVSYCG